MDTKISQLLSFIKISLIINIFLDKRDFCFLKSLFKNVFYKQYTHTYPHKSYFLKVLSGDKGLIKVMP
jgi:hypothetical protein